MSKYGSKQPDENQSHRVCQAFQLIQFVKSHHPQFAIICGDFNCTPHSEPYNVITSYGQMQDAWLQLAEEETNDGITLNRPENVYRKLHEAPMRIDYVFYGTAPGRSSALTCQSCEVIMGQIPGTNICFSDHNGLYAEFEIGETLKDTGIAQLQTVASDSIVVAKQLTSFGLQSASNRCHHQMVAFLFFLSLWITLVVIGAFPLLLFLVSLNSIGSVELSTPLFGLLLCAASTLAGAFGLLSCVITPIEINRLTQFLQEMTMLCHAQ
jgi:hypothetical protein